MKINAVYKILDKPLIYAGTGTAKWHKLSPHDSLRPAYFLCHPMWHFGLSSFRHYARARSTLKEKNIDLLLMHNSQRELRNSKLAGFGGILINQNIHTCEQTFVNLGGVEKKHDAVYTAAAASYKRMHIARKIASLFVITYFWPDKRNDAGEWDLHGFEPRIHNASFNTDRIDKTRVNLLLNQSCCGLALSRKEGAMWASMEYLMAGIPVVTTPSLGGRDHFFDKTNAVTVRWPTASRVARAVAEMKARRIDPVVIRSAVLKKVSVVRRQYYNKVCELCNSQAISLEESFADFSERVWGGDGIQKLRCT